MVARSTPAINDGREYEEMSLLLAEHERMSQVWRQRLQATLAGIEELDDQRRVIWAAVGGIAPVRVPGDAAVPNPDLPLPPLPTLMDAYERTLLRSALARTGGNQKEAAALLGIRPTTLHEKLKRLGLAHPRKRGR